MSIAVSKLVWDHSEAKGGARLVLLALADHAHADGSNSFPSVETIARETRQCERNVQYNLRKLESLGEIKPEKAGGGRWATNYRIEVQILQGRKACTGAVDCTSGAQWVAPQGRNGLHPNRQGTTKEPSSKKEDFSGSKKTGTEWA